MEQHVQVSVREKLCSTSDGVNAIEASRHQGAGARSPIAHSKKLVQSQGTGGPSFGGVVGIHREIAHLVAAVPSGLGLALYGRAIAGVKSVRAKSLP